MDKTEEFPEFESEHMSQKEREEYAAELNQYPTNRSEEGLNNIQKDYQIEEELNNQSNDNQNEQSLNDLTNNIDNKQGRNFN